MKINGKEIRTNGYFGYDRCHKIYICENDAQVDELVSLGYQILHICELAETYRNSCPMRFIDSADLQTVYCPQCVEAVIEESEAAVCNS